MGNEINRKESKKPWWGKIGKIFLKFFTKTSPAPILFNDSTLKNAKFEDPEEDYGYAEPADTLNTTNPFKTFNPNFPPLNTGFNERDANNNDDLLTQVDESLFYDTKKDETYGALAQIPEDNNSEDKKDKRPSIVSMTSLTSSILDGFDSLNTDTNTDPDSPYNDDDIECDNSDTKSEGFGFNDDDDKSETGSSYNGFYSSDDENTENQAPNNNIQKKIDALTKPQENTIPKTQVEGVGKLKFEDLKSRFSLNGKNNPER